MPSPLFYLQSTVVVEKSIQDLMNLMQDLSSYSNQFLEMVCDKLKEYKDICNTAYRYKVVVTGSGGGGLKTGFSIFKSCATEK